MPLGKSSLLMIALIVLLNAFNCGISVAPQQATIKIDPQQKFQTMSGWEATAQAGENYSPSFERYNEKLFDEAVDDLGINRLRLELRSGAENPKDYFSAFATEEIDEQGWRAHYYEAINDNNDPFVINPNGFHFSEMDSTIEKIILPMRRRLATRGESLFVNLCYVDFAQGRGRSNISHKNDPEEYAEIILAAYQHLQAKYGFVPDAVEVILEPDNKTGWTGTEIGRAAVAAANRLRAHGFKPSFIAPSTTNAANAPVFIDDIARVPDAMQFIAEFSYHRYCCASAEVLNEIADRAAKYGKRTSMLEWIGAYYETLHEDLKTGKVSAWQEYTLAFPNQPDNGAQYFLVNDQNSAAPQTTISQRAKFLRQYFRYIRAGAERIGAETTNENFDPLAFVNTDGKTVVVIKADAPGTITVQNLPPGNYGISFMTERQSDGGEPDSLVNNGETLSATIPANGVLTVYAK